MGKVTHLPTWVVKIGSAMITDDGKGIDTERVLHWCEQISALKHEGVNVIVVSSGAVAEGMKQLGWNERPQFLNELQAAASVGQTHLVNAWKEGFEAFHYIVGQVLITHEDAADRTRYLNIKATLQTLLQHNAIPVINENDTISFDEIKFGDNDTLGALVASLVDADAYIILTDQKGIYDSDPRKNPNAILIETAEAFDERLMKMASPFGGKLGTGGMYTKVKAAHIAAKSGAITYIAKGDTDNILLSLFQGNNVGTRLTPSKTKVDARKRWMLGQRQIKGTLVVDKGAEDALLIHKKSLLPIGVIAVEGMFERGDIVACVNQAGKEIGRGLSNYNCLEVQKILQTHSDDIVKKLGFIISDEMIHRNNWIEIQ